MRKKLSACKDKLKNVICELKKIYPISDEDEERIERGAFPWRGQNDNVLESGKFEVDLFSIWYFFLNCTSISLF